MVVALLVGTMLSLTNILGRWGRQNGDHDFDGGGDRSIITLLNGFMISLQLHYKRLASRSTDVSPGAEGH